MAIEVFFFCFGTKVTVAVQTFPCCFLWTETTPSFVRPFCCWLLVLPVLFGRLANDCPLAPLSPPVFPIVPILSTAWHTAILYILARTEAPTNVFNFAPAFSPALGPHIYISIQYMYIWNMWVQWLLHFPFENGNSCRYDVLVVLARVCYIWLGYIYNTYQSCCERSARFYARRARSARELRAS